jgi:hypothetical protein
MVARGTKRTSCAFLVLVMVLSAMSLAHAWDQKYRYPVKVRVSGAHTSDPTVAGIRLGPGREVGDWETAAGASRRALLCPRSGYNFEAGMRPFFSNLSGAAKTLSRGGEGTFLQLHGHLRVPAENTLWEFYAHLRMWDKVTARLTYVPWNWGGPGHAGADGNFAGLPLIQGDAITSDLSITSFVLGADYDVSFGRDLVFGPNADLYIVRWSQRVGKDLGEAMDFSQTLLQPTIGAHIRYEPTNTGYFSWFKPYLEARFGWMSFNGLGLSTWNMGAGIAPPLSRNVDAGFKLGYKQWKLDGSRNRLYANVGVEGLYLDFSLRF